MRMMWLRGAGGLTVSLVSYWITQGTRLGAAHGHDQDRG